MLLQGGIYALIMAAVGVWSSGLCNFPDHCCFCLYAFCCPCCAYGTLAVKTPPPSEPLLFCIVPTILDSFMTPTTTCPCPVLSAASAFLSSTEGRDPRSNVGHADCRAVGTWVSRIELDIYSKVAGSPVAQSPLLQHWGVAGRSSSSFSSGRARESSLLTTYWSEST